MKRIQLLLASLLFGLGMLMPLATVSAATSQTQAKDRVCEALGSCAQDAGDRSISEIVEQIINILSWVVGIAAVLAIIFGGFRYVTATGDSSKISTAKDTILYALIGVVVVAMAQILVRFVIGRI